MQTPAIFSMFWKLIVGWLDERTMRRFKILQGDGKEELLRHIDEENLPSFLGGKCRCNYVGGCVPWASNPSYERFNYAGDAQKLTILAGKQKKVEIDVESGQKVVWFLQSVGGDIGIQLTADSNPKERVLIPNQRMPTNRLLSGECINQSAHSKTKLIFVFHNKSSWTSKDIYFKVYQTNVNEESVTTSFRWQF